MADQVCRVVFVVPVCETWAFTAQWRTTAVGKYAKQALRISQALSRGAALDVVFYGRAADGSGDVAVRTRLDADRQEEWLRDWTYLPEEWVNLSKQPRKGARIDEVFGRDIMRGVVPLPAVSEVFDMTAERPGDTLVLFWLADVPADAYNDAVFFLRHHDAPRVLWQFLTVVERTRANRFWKRDGRNRGADLPSVRFRSAWGSRAFLREFRRWQRSEKGQAARS